MDPYRLPDSAPGSTTSPTRRKLRSKSGNGAKHTAHDPVLELMMCNLMQRQSLNNTATKQNLEPAFIVSHPYTSSSITGTSGLCSPPKRPCCCGLWQKLWFRVLLAVLLLIGLVLAIALPLGLKRAAAKRAMQPPQYDLGPRLNTSGMNLVFAEDFTSFDTATWNVELGDGADYGLQSWGNNELQCYTSSPNNLDVIPHPDYPDDDGVLRIRPVYSSTALQCQNVRAPNSTRQWTSAKIDTKNKVAFTWSGQQKYTGMLAGPTAGASRRSLLDARDIPAAAASATGSGTCGSVVVESRMKLPVAAGRWSALWMMPQPQPCPAGSGATECGKYGPWPASGEIDIVEQVNTKAEVLGTIHYADTGGIHRYLGGSLPLSEEALLGWNIYQLVWNCSSITWYVNTMQVYQVTKQQLGAARWPFDQPFFLIINTAVGGWLTGNVTPDKAESHPFLVDYVRVYARPAV